MNRTFKQLTAEQRYQIATLLSKQFNQKQIAEYIGKSTSCVSRRLPEIRCIPADMMLRMHISTLCSGIRSSKSINTLRTRTIAGSPSLQQELSPSKSAAV
ncbi:MAG: helix-turn-helix domain-containing protein [Sphingobacteriales bacterium]|nr:helix-turn-helix domain-containing protein [Sphingobacteriales bacterium]